MAMFLPIAAEVAEGGTAALAGGGEAAAGGAAAGAEGGAGGGMMSKVTSMLNPGQFAKGLLGGSAGGGKGGSGAKDTDPEILGSSSDWERS